MATKVEIRDNGELVVTGLSLLRKASADLREPLSAFGRHMKHTSVPDTFKAGGRPNRWLKSPWTSERVQMDTGRLLQSVEYDADNNKVRVGTNLKYAAQRHFGGTIKAKGNHPLAVPLPGLPRTMRRASRWGDRLVKVVPQKGDASSRGVLADLKTYKRKADKITPRFVLRGSVTQPARPFLVILPDDYVVLGRLLNQHLARGWR